MKKMRKTTDDGHRLTMNSHPRLAFKLDEYQRRYDLVLANMKRAKVDALLVRSPENITYLTGYETPGYYGYHCLIVAQGEQPTLVGRRLELTNVPEFSWLAHTVAVRRPRAPGQYDGADSRAARARAQEARGREERVVLHRPRSTSRCRAFLPKARFIDASNTVEAARLIKSDAEVETIRAAVRIADKACLAGIKATKAGVTEDRIAGALHKVWCEQGAEPTGLPNFIVSGRRSAACHATWRGRTMGQNDHCIFEIAASKNRYCGAVFRCATVGKVRPKLRKLYNTTEEALNTVVDAMRPGVVSEKVNRLGHGVFVKNGFGDWHRHRIGYSIGVNWAPDWGEGQIFSIRPGREAPAGGEHDLPPGARLPHLERHGRRLQCIGAHHRHRLRGAEHPAVEALRELTRFTSWPRLRDRAIDVAHRQHRGYHEAFGGARRKSRGSSRCRGARARAESAGPAN